MKATSTFVTERARAHSALIIEEDIDILQAVAELVDDCGYRVAVALGGDDALALVRLLRFDLVVLEPCVCTRAGEPVLARLRGYPNAAKAAVIAVTTLRGSGIEQSLRALGCDDIVFKPCTSRQILDALDRHAPSRGAPNVRLPGGKNASQERAR